MAFLRPEPGAAHCGCASRGGAGRKRASRWGGGRGRGCGAGPGPDPEPGRGGLRVFVARECQVRGPEGGGGCLKPEGRRRCGRDAGDPARAAAERAAGFYLRVGIRWEQKGAGGWAEELGICPRRRLPVLPAPGTFLSCASRPAQESNELSGVGLAAQSNLGPNRLALTCIPGARGGRERRGVSRGIRGTSWLHRPAGEGSHVRERASAPSNASETSAGLGLCAFAARTGVGPPPPPQAEGGRRCSFPLVTVESSASWVSSLRCP